MANNGIKVSELVIANTVVTGDRLVIYRPNVNPAVRTIAFTNIIPGPFANNAAANIGGVALKGLYYDSSGNVKIRLT